MKVMVFHIGAECYALPLAGVLRVLPVAHLNVRSVQCGVQREAVSDHAAEHVRRTARS